MSGPIYEREPREVYFLQRWPSTKKMKQIRQRVHELTKSMPWEFLDNLFERGLISDPQSKAKSVVVSPKGDALARRLFDKNFRG
jgi:hypothetical protein